MRFLLNVERDEFFLSRRWAPSFTNPVFTPGGKHRKKSSCIRGSLSLCNAFNIKLASRNIISELDIIHTAIGCECNCHHFCRFLGKTPVPILSESRRLPPENEFFTGNNRSCAGPSTIFNFRRNGNR